MIQRIMVPGIMAPVSHYCHVVRAGNLVWVSGIVGMEANGHIPPDTVAQFDHAYPGEPIEVVGSRHAFESLSRSTC